MRYFGTDGIRKQSAFFDEDFLSLFALGVATLPMCRHVVIGRDTRVSGERIVESIEKTLLLHGVDVTDVGIVPSPCLALCTKELRCDYGIMVTASHNPPSFNGLKLFSAAGSKIPKSEEIRLETFLCDPFYLPIKQGSFDRADGYALYLRHAQTVFPSVHNKKILMDCAYGAASGFADRIFRDLGAEVVAVCNEKRGEKINILCGATCITNVIGSYDDSFDAAFSCDGDADRVFCYKEKIFDGDALVYLAAKSAFLSGKLPKNAVCGTVTTNSAYENDYIRNGISFYRSDVGDREVHDLMRRTGARIGGETSGHVIFDDVLETGDGLFTAAVFCSLSDRLRDLGLFDLKPYPTCRTEILLNEKDAAFLRERSSSVYSNVGGVYALVRISGTEPMIRIMTESKDREKAEEKMHTLRDRAWEVLLDHQLD